MWLHFIYSSSLRSQSQLKSFSIVYNNILNLHTQHYGCWCFGLLWGHQQSCYWPTYLEIFLFQHWHYNDVLMGLMASQITSLTIVYSAAYFGHRSKKTSKLCVTGLCAGNSPGTGEFPAQMASNAENVSIWWRHHDVEPVLSHYMNQWWTWPLSEPVMSHHKQQTAIPDSKVHGANIGPIWGRQDPGGPHVGPMNLAIWDVLF